MPALLLPVTPADLRPLGRVAYQTGFFGESAARYFPDERLFALLWVWPYLRTQTPGNLAACGAGGEMLGYILGETSPARYRRHLAAATLLGSLATLGGEVRHAPLACWSHLGRLARFSAPHASERLYPAHLHINLLPQARGLGLGRQLLGAHLAALERAGVPGVQLSATAENSAALGLYFSAGFSVLAEQETDLWTPWLGRPTRQLVLGLRLA
ncbi:GNAT family N-acetyltransferase [Deinococcus lacus]|uniref:GNAT family N-acetyltransferase n=1 Tax=Deinococcus lacus TaxID=392561 RepID=A0ABW1YCN6_9DEIO